MKNRLRDKHFVLGRAIKSLKIRYLFDMAMNSKRFVQEKPRNTAFARGTLNTADNSNSVNSRAKSTLC